MWRLWLTNQCDLPPTDKSFTHTPSVTSRYTDTRFLLPRLFRCSSHHQSSPSTTHSPVADLCARVEYYLPLLLIITLPLLSAAVPTARQVPGGSPRLDGPDHFSSSHLAPGQYFTLQPGYQIPILVAVKLEPPICFLIPRTPPSLHPTENHPPFLPDILHHSFLTPVTDLPRPAVKISRTLQSPQLDPSICSVDMRACTKNRDLSRPISVTGDPEITEFIKRSSPVTIRHGHRAFHQHRRHGNDDTTRTLRVRQHLFLGLRSPLSRQTGLPSKGASSSAR